MPCEAASAEAKTTGISAAESVLGRAANIQALGDYCFMGYERAKKQFDPSDYRREYAYMLPKDMTLEEVFSRHNADTRPISMRMRSMSVSDVLVVNRGGKKTAYYVDSFGFQEVKQFFKQKAPKKNERQPTKRKCALSLYLIHV